MLLTSSSTGVDNTSLSTVKYPLFLLNSSTEEYM
ncbi:hypothetical protein I314_01332 [Cryptococcus bacillisporus CA1873]|uniref:Uncharacterized protein n=2 Tax=Cryptococcus gattii TaxID=552467 RepID=A0A0D0VQV6_CRYGA|nr:hypothetical protein I312_01664 [Cryptococcus bacillisporus CA1280]KIR67843.1 hypothetical protein I314_01332 [Cryptococcus bacillisporus CA1873]|eukprot:KIR67843.1 hypothetical protein I314_01332 [Cryptococcus gattii CA1873]